MKCNTQTQAQKFLFLFYLDTIYYTSNGQVRGGDILLDPGLQKWGVVFASACPECDEPAARPGRAVVLVRKRFDPDTKFVELIRSNNPSVKSVTSGLVRAGGSCVGRVWRRLQGRRA